VAKLGKAHTLELAARNWLRGVVVDKESLFYVPRPSDFKSTQQLILTLTDAAEAGYPDKFFFVGQKGCGKSTELNTLRVDKDICKYYHPFNFSIQDVANIQDLEYSDILFLIVAKLLDEYPLDGSKSLKKAKAIISKKQNFIAILRKFPELFDIEFNLEFIKIKLNEPKSRETLRNELQKNSHDLLELISDTSLLIQKEKHKRPLILIDDLDKPSIEIQKKLFIDNRDALLQPDCHVVYTVNHAITHQDDFVNIHDRVVTVPYVSIHHPPWDEGMMTHISGRQFLKEVILRRMDETLFANGVLDKMIDLSGGALDQMRDLLTETISRARLREGHRIEERDLIGACIRFMNPYDRLLNDDDLTILREIHDNHKRVRNASIARLIFMRALLEYQNENIWWDINPILKWLVKQ
jgi:hypothetical protein